MTMHNRPLAFGVSANSDPSVRTFRSGKLCVSKGPTKNDERRVLMRIFIYQFDRALESRARDLDTIHAEQSIPENLVDLLYEFFGRVTKLNDATTNHRGKVPPKTLSNARTTKRLLETFKAEYDVLAARTQYSPNLHSVLCDLIEDAEHFVQSIEMTHGIVTVVEGVPQMRNRQRNVGAMTAFGQVVEDWRQGSDDEGLPATYLIKSRLFKQGHAISERTIRHWKQQVENNTFGDFVQKINGNK